MPPEREASRPPAADAPQERVSTVLGNRLCAGCAYNLCGQPVVRDGRLGLLLVRCPECGLPAALQEYPSLGRWATRWAGLLAALWYLGLILLLVATTLPQATLAMGAKETIEQVLAERIEALHESEAAVAAGTATPGGATPTGTPAVAGGGGGQFAAWWSAQDPATVMKRVRGAGPLVEPLGLLAAAWAGLAAFLAGTVWAPVIALPRRKVLWWWPVLAAGFFGWIALFTSGEDVTWGGASPWTVAEGLVGAWPAYVVGCLAAACVGPGLALGRPLVRGLARLLLPDELRAALSGLWLIDGKDPPGARRRS